MIIVYRYKSYRVLIMGDPNKLALNMATVVALRDFAGAMPVSIENIKESTEKLLQLYDAVSENLGVHNGDFTYMLKIVSDAQKSAEEVIEILPKCLSSLASDIEVFVLSQR